MSSSHPPLVTRHTSLVTRLVLVRHGETAWNREGRVQGHADPPLNETGRGQARAIAESLARYDFAAAYASDSQRATQTAEIILAGRSVRLVSRPELRERFLGRWEGLLARDLATLDPDNWQAWLERPRDWAPHGGETEVELETRVVAALDAIVRDHPGRTVLVVTHGGAIRAALSAWLGVDRHDVPNCGAYIVEIGVDGRRLVEELFCDMA